MFLLTKMVEEAKSAEPQTEGAKDSVPENAGDEKEKLEWIDADYLKQNYLENSVLLGLADEMGEAISGIRGNALRRSVTLPVLDRKKLENGEILPYLKQEEFEEPHRCGELLVAAIMRTFFKIWITRIEELKKGLTDRKNISRKLVVEQGSDAASHLLTMAIRAIDYTPPTDISFGDYLSALLTADSETVPDDTKYNYRKHLREMFADYGIEPSSFNEDDSGNWLRESARYNYDRIRFDSLQRSRDEVFRFIWDNRKTLGLAENAYTRVQSVRPCMRITPDGFVLRETVAEYVQYITIQACELQQLSVPIGKTERNAARNGSNFIRRRNADFR